MRISDVQIKNYRSFDAEGQTILFPMPHCILVGKNNSGKTNIINALDIMLGYKTPLYAELQDDDYYDSKQPIEIKITISDINENDLRGLYAITYLTKEQKGALKAKTEKGKANIVLHLIKHCKNNWDDEDEDNAKDKKDSFELNLWGFSAHKNIDKIRKSLMKMIVVPAIRDSEKQLTASKWTYFGQLMKEVLESSPNYNEVKSYLSELNAKMQAIFEEEKNKLLEGARVVSYVEDLEFRLTKENQPSELLRNLEIYIKENAKKFNIDHVGTGTQSAVIIGILELALRRKSANTKIFCIEEPEIFIHPHGIRYLGSLIKNVSAEDNTQVIVSSHSLSLTAYFQPAEIIKVEKIDGRTVVIQSDKLSSSHYKRFINQDNAEVLFSDRVVFIEGLTEKLLLCSLDKITKLDPSNSNGHNCNYDRINVGIIRLDSVDNIVNYMKIASAFNVKYSFLADKDFINKTSCRNLCGELGISYQTSDVAKLISELKNKNVIVNSKGEIEDIFSDEELASISGKTAIEIADIKSKHPAKTSEAFKEIFDVRSKPEYTMRIIDYYETNKATHPLEDIIRKLYTNDIINIAI